VTSESVRGAKSRSYPSTAMKRNMVSGLVNQAMVNVLSEWYSFVSRFIYLRIDGVPMLVFSPIILRAY
jgi:hypothetical protein